MTSSRRQNSRLIGTGVFAALVCIGAVAMAVIPHTTDNQGLAPPLPDEPASNEVTTSPTHPSSSSHADQAEPSPVAPVGAASLAGSPDSVVRRFARDWANRDVELTPSIKREMIGLSAGAWASAVFRQARLTLPAIEGVRAEGDMVMMKLTSIAPGSKMALVVTQERLLDPDGSFSSPRYALYLARLDQVMPQGYAITAWEPQQ